MDVNRREGFVKRNWGLIYAVISLFFDVLLLNLGLILGILLRFGNLQNLKYYTKAQLFMNAVFVLVSLGLGVYRSRYNLSSEDLRYYYKRLIIYIAIDYPKNGEYLGGRIAAPVVREYLDFLVPYLDVPVEGDNRVVHPGRITVSPINLPAMTDRIPDFTGLPKRTLLPLLSREDVTVVINGYGWVVRQDPAPGTALEPGMIITLELE